MPVALTTCPLLDIFVVNFCCPLSSVARDLTLSNMSRTAEEVYKLTESTYKVSVGVWSTGAMTTRGEKDLRAPPRQPLTRYTCFTAGGRRLGAPAPLNQVFLISLIGVLSRQTLPGKALLSLECGGGFLFLFFTFYYKVAYCKEMCDKQTICGISIEYCATRRSRFPRESAASVHQRRHECLGSYKVNWKWRHKGHLCVTFIWLELDVCTSIQFL